MTAIEARLTAEWMKVRVLHAPVPVVNSAGVMYAMDGSGEMQVRTTHSLECACCRGVSLLREWPCATARIVFTEQEIAKVRADTYAKEKE